MTKIWLIAIFVSLWLAEQGNAATINAASCASSAITTAINAASPGDTVSVPAGTNCSLPSSTISGISVIGAGKTTSGSVVTSGSLTLDKHATYVTRMSGFRFTHSGLKFRATGSRTNKPFIVDNIYAVIGSPDTFVIETNGGIVHSSDFVASGGSSADTIRVQLGAATDEWQQPVTLGSMDSTGERNIYFEDNTWTGFLEISWDCDNGGRVVARHNTFTDSSITAHGGGSGTSGNDTSTVGCRHMEIYDNTFVRVSNAYAINKWVWMRGASGVIANNVIPRADSPDGSSYPNKNELQLSVGCPGAYPVRYQVGQTSDTADATPDYPLAIFGNTGAGTSDSNFITQNQNPNNSCANPSSYIQAGRDYVTSNTWGWSSYTYPHPLRAGGDTQAPTAPSGLSATTASYSQINLSWTAGTDNVGIAGYDIQQCSGSGCTPSGTIYQTSGTGTTYSSTGLSASTLYRYWVRSRDAAGNVSAYTSIAQATTSAAPTYTVTPSSGANGSISPSSPQTVTGGTTTQFSITANSTYQATVAGTCGGSPSTGTGTFTYTTSAITANCTVTVTFSVITGPAALPEGPGLAAAYPNDSGIAADPAVIFFDGFEYTSASQLTSSGNWSQYYQSANTSIVTSPVFSGNKSLQFQLPATSSEIANAVTKNLASTYDTIFVRVYERFQNGFAVPQGGHNGIRISAGVYPGAGFIPTGSDFYMSIEQNVPYYGESPPGYTSAYTYHPEQRSQWGDLFYPDGKVLPYDATPGNFGSFFVSRPNFIPQYDRWYCYEFMLKANTPGQRDGRLAVWVDGVLIADWQNMRWRDVSTVKINHIELELHGQTNPALTRKWYDNVVIATSYIGPMATLIQLPAPLNLRWSPR